MARITDARLRAAEKAAPKPFQSITLAWTAVAPNPASGSPVPIGVGAIQRTRRHATPIDRYFDPPRADLLDADFDEWTDEEIAALGVARD